MDSFFSLLLLAIVSFATFLNVLVALSTLEKDKKKERKKESTKLVKYIPSDFFFLLHSNHAGRKNCYNITDFFFFSSVQRVKTL